MGVVQDIPRSIRARAILDINITAGQTFGGGGGASLLSRRTYEAHEDLVAGDVVAIMNNGTICKASAEVSDGLPAFAVVSEGATTGNRASVFYDGEACALPSGEFTVGDYVYLGETGGVYPSYWYEAGYYLQRLGVVVSSTTFIVMVGKYYAMR